MSSLKQRIEETLSGAKMNPAEFQELELDGSRSASGHIEGLSDEWQSLVRLSLMGCSLTSLKGLPKLPSLRKLDLSDNKVADGLDIIVKNCPDVTHLHLAGNKIKDVNALKPLADLKALDTLELFNCDIAESDDYRSKVFETLPNLFFLDGKDRDGQDAPEEDEDDDLDGDEEDDDDIDERELEGDEDYEGADDDDEEDGEGDGDDEEATAPRGRKRRHDEEEEEDGEGDDDD